MKWITREPPKIDRLAGPRLVERFVGKAPEYRFGPAELVYAVAEGGTEIPPSMGTAIAINLQPADAGRAATTGDFVLTSDEVNPVDEQPRLFFLHFWAVDDATKLSNGLRAALDKVAIKREAQ